MLITDKKELRRFCRFALINLLTKKVLKIDTNIDINSSF